MRTRILSSVLLVTGTAVAQLPTHVHETRPPHPADWNPHPQEVFVSYWTLEAGWETHLEIRNNVVLRDLIVTPILRTAAGKEVSLAQITIPPEHVAEIDLRQAVLPKAPELLDRTDSFGSLICRYSANSPGAIFAASMVQRIGTPIGFHFDNQRVEAEWQSRKHRKRLVAAALQHFGLPDFEQCI